MNIFVFSPVGRIYLYEYIFIFSLFIFSLVTWLHEYIYIFASEDIYIFARFYINKSWWWRNIYSVRS